MDPTALLIRTALFPAWVRKNRSGRLAYLRDLERTQYLTPDQLRDLQWVQLRSLLEHAYEHCAFYRGKFQAAGLTPADVRRPGDISLVPQTTKTEIQEHQRELIAEPFRERALIKDMTGGSTGSPMVFYYDEDRRDSRTAAALRHDRWTGWDIGEKLAVLWGAPRDVARQPRWQTRVRDWIIQRSLVLDASAIDDATMLAFCGKLRTYRPQFVLAYANTLALFARFVRDAGLTPMRPKAIICSGEFLTPESRDLIESTFGCAVFNRYGSREFSVIASECAAHQGMHVNAENLLVEVLVNEVPSSGQDGELVITDLRNRAMPLIRYRTRDTGRLEPGACRCGRGLPLLHLTGGRTTDFLTAANGQKVSGIVLSTYGITDIAGIRQVQFVQDRLGAVTARIARGPEWSDDSFAALAARIHGLLGESMTIETEYVDRIPLEASGKYRFSVSRLGP
jgi:phenylacetate-coenzyme A ligase PaaK-like adenylate-forming protein